MSQRILLVGASGWLGSQILSALKRADADVHVLLRGGAAHPKAAALGAPIVAGDLADVASLMAATEGVHTIVSAVQGGPDLIVDGQAALARAARRNGVQLIFTSDYSVRFDGITEKEHLFLGWRAKAHSAITEIGLPQVHPLNGAFMEMLAQPFFGLVDWDRKAVTFWGDADQPYQFTRTGDVAAYVAAAALDHDVPIGAFEVVGDTASPRALAQLLQETTGSAFSLKALGDLAALDSEIARRQSSSPQDPAPWAGLQYHRLMASGAGTLHAPQNARFPGITPMTIRQWLQTHAESA
jgi:nucleoside-diphosphate-sugar epimerase